MQHDFILLDRSGSMGSQWSEAINSVNVYVKKLADDNVDTGVTLAVFDTGPVGTLDFNVLRDRIVPTTWLPVTETEVAPRNTTPLNDATARIVSLAKAGNYDKCAIIIMTDGMENASREYRGSKGTAAIRAMLDECRNRGWQVIFLGANFDNAAQALDYGNAALATVEVATANLGATTRSLASKRADYGSGIAASMSFTDAEKARAKAK